MDRNSEHSNIEKALQKTKKLNSTYCEIITTDHTQNPAVGEEGKKPGVLSKGLFLLDDTSGSFSNQEYKFRFDNENLTFSSLKSSMESIIQQVLAKDKSNVTELQEFLNNISDDKANDDVHKLVLKFYMTFGQLKDPLLLTRRLNNAFQNQENPKDNDADLVVLKSFYSALTNLPTYSGRCVRAIDLNPNEREIYQKGSVINWKFFNSCSKGDKPVPPFDQRNTYFYITSLTGRDISDAGEVLFPPGCNFIVEDKKVENEGEGEKEKTHITLKQVEVIFTENIVLWVGDEISNQETRFLSKLYDQKYKYHLWVVEKPNAKEMIKYIEEKLAGYLSQCKSFQVIVKPKTLQEDAHNDLIAYLNKILHQQGKVCSFYCLKEKECENSSLGKNQDYAIVESTNNLMEDLKAKFIYKEQQLFSNEDDNGFNEESYENSNTPEEGRDFNLPNLANESSVQYEQNTLTQPLQNSQTQTGNLNTLATSEQTENLPNKHSYLESTSQFK